MFTSSQSGPGLQRHLCGGLAFGSFGLHFLCQETCFSMQSWTLSTVQGRLTKIYVRPSKTKEEPTHPGEDFLRRPFHWQANSLDFVWLINSRSNTLFARGSAHMCAYDSSGYVSKLTPCLCVRLRACTRECLLLCVCAFVSVCLRARLCPRVHSCMGACSGMREMSCVRWGGWVCRCVLALLCFALLCFALLCFALLCFALLCFALLCLPCLLCFALLCFALLCFALLCFALLSKLCLLACC